MMDLRDALPAEELVLMWIFEAPREIVWKAFTDADVLAKWWRPKGFEWISGRLELRPGGMHLYGMRAAGGGMEMWGKWALNQLVEYLRGACFGSDTQFLNDVSDLQGYPK